MVGTYPSQCAVGDQIFYNAEANSIAAGHGFVEPLWSVTHPGQQAPPAADHPPVTVIVLAGVNWLVDHPPVSWIDNGDRFDTNVREDRYAMALFGTILVLLIGLLGRRVGRAVPRVSADAVGLVAAGIAAVVAQHLGERRADHGRDAHGGRGGRGVSPRVRALGPADARARRGARCPVRRGRAGPGRADPVRAAARRRGRAGDACLVVEPHRFRVRGRRREHRRDRPVGRLQPRSLQRFHLRLDQRRDRARGLELQQRVLRERDRADVDRGPDACIDNPPPPGDQSQVATVYRKRAFHYMRTHLRRVPLVVAARIGRTWSVFRPIDMVAFNKGEGREAWVTRIGLVVYYPTLVGAVAGAVLMWRRRARRALWVLLVPAIAATVGRRRDLRADPVPRRGRTVARDPRGRGGRGAGGCAASSSGGAALNPRRHDDTA